MSRILIVEDEESFSDPLSYLLEKEGFEVTVAAGEVWDEVVARAVAEGWSGIEALSGIPGTVGATPIQNVGAYGQERVSILEGLKESDWVVAAGVHVLLDGQKVRPVDRDNRVVALVGKE